MVANSLILDANSDLRINVVTTKSAEDRPANLRCRPVPSVLARATVSENLANDFGAKPKTIVSWWT